MSVEDKSIGKSFIPQWDGKTSSYALYREQFFAVSVFSGCPDVMDETEMRNMPTKTVYSAIVGRNTTTSPHSPDEERQIDLYRQNMKMCSVFTLGQTSNHGVMVLVETKSDDYPHGKVWTAFRTLDKKFKPKDFTAEIECENALDALSFSRADEFYTDVVNICARYENQLSDTAKLKYLAKKCQSSTYAKIVSEQLDANTPDFEKACDEIAKIQRLVKASNKKEVPKSTGKEVTLTSTEKGSSSEKKPCGHCGVKGHSKKDCNKRKEAIKKQGDCPECGKSGHLEKECWKKDPSKAPKWWSKDGKGKETSSASVELVIPAIEQDFA